MDHWTMCLRFRDESTSCLYLIFESPLSPQCTMVHVPDNLIQWWPHYLSRQLGTQNRISSIYFRIGIIVWISSQQGWGKKSNWISDKLGIWSECLHALNIARLLRFNVCLICVLGYFLLKVNVGKKMSFETDGFVLKNVLHLEIVKG